MTFDLFVCHVPPTPSFTTPPAPSLYSTHSQIPQATMQIAKTVTIASPAGYGSGNL